MTPRSCSVSNSCLYARSRDVGLYCTNLGRWRRIDVFSYCKSVMIHKLKAVLFVISSYEPALSQFTMSGLT